MMIHSTMFEESKELKSSIQAYVHLKAKYNPTKIIYLLLD